MKTNIDLLLVNARVATLAGFSAHPQRGSDFGRLGLVENGAVAISGDKIIGVGPLEELSSQLDFAGAEVIDAGGRLVTPGLVDPHTHVIHCGSREREYNMRLAGMPYLEIHKAGGGILNSVRSTREASLADLVSQSKKSLERMLAFGVTTVEAKSGYGLDLASEIKMLQAVQILNRIQPLELIPTFMGAHAIPEEFKGRGDEFVQVIVEMLPKVRHLARFCDVFCEEGVFSIDQSRRILQAARDLGMELKIHADELAATGGAQLAAELEAVSADHLLCTDRKGIEALAAANTVAVLLPGTSFNLMARRYAPAREMLAAGVAIALSTDYNPGSCPTENLQLIMTLGCLKLGLTPAQVLAAVTINAAHALKLGEKIGSLERGKQADLVIFDTDNEAYIPYHFGINHTWMVIKSGRPVYPPANTKRRFLDEN
mgnify:CR=1 FL=1|jgi:imidazolonepropionase